METSEQQKGIFKVQEKTANLELLKLLKKIFKIGGREIFK